LELAVVLNDNSLACHLNLLYPDVLDQSLTITQSGAVLVYK